MESIYNINSIKILIKFLGKNILFKKNKEEKIKEEDNLNNKTLGSQNYDFNSQNKEEDNLNSKTLGSQNYDFNNKNNLIKNNNNNNNLKNIDNNIDKEIYKELFNNLNNQNIQNQNNLINEKRKFDKDQRDSKLDRFNKNQSTKYNNNGNNQSDIEEFKKEESSNFKNIKKESQENSINQNKTNIIGQNNDANNNNFYGSNNQGNCPPPINMGNYKMQNMNNNPPISHINNNNYKDLYMNSNKVNNPKINEKNTNQNFSLFNLDNNPKIGNYNNNYNSIQREKYKNNIYIEKKKFNNSNELNNNKKRYENNNDIEKRELKYYDKTFDSLEQIFYTGNRNYNMIDNNIKKGEGIVQLIELYSENKIKIKKKLLLNVNSFIACIGPPGAGKSTFCSNYYKTLYKVKNNYFESSEQDLTFTKGIWIITDIERRKIPIMIKKDLIDVEGFQVDDAKCWKYVMIIAFLSTDLIILNRNARNDDLKKIIRIIEKSLKIMGEKNIPRILKNIFIHTSKKKNNKPIEEIKKDYIMDTKIFKGISFEYIYLPNITEEDLEENNSDLMSCPNYKSNFKEILKKLENQHLLVNSVSSLIDYIDIFNETINGNSGFNTQTILKDIELDFNGVYSRYETKLKNKLSKRIEYLIKLESLEETFDRFIIKQKDLTFTFEINNDDFTFYGSCDNFDNFYENLKKKKNFRIDPKDIFFDVYQAQRKYLEIQEKKRKLEEEQKRREEEMKRKIEEQKRREEEEERKIMAEKERRRRQEEMERKIDEEKKRQREEQRRKEEEEFKRQKEEKERKRREEQKRQEEELKRKMEEQKKLLEEEEKLNNLFNEKIREINNYYAKLKFYEEINMDDEDLRLNIETILEDKKHEYNNELIKHYNKKFEEKKKEWQAQIERAKWKCTVQGEGDLTCKKGCKLKPEVICGECEGPLYWVDSDEKYAICQNCGKGALRKITENPKCMCGAEANASVKWIIGYKP